jgi:hypothetical protein
LRSCGQHGGTDLGLERLAALVAVALPGQLVFKIAERM